MIGYCCMDKYVKLLWLLCFGVWICLFSVRVLRTILLICLFVMDSYLSLCDGHICDCIVFDVWCAVTTSGMFFGVFLGWVTTLWVKIGLFLGWCTTFEIFECIRETDTTERFFVFGRKTSVCKTKTHIANWIYCNGSAITDQTKRYHNTVLLWYILRHDGGVVYILE